MIAEVAIPISFTSNEVFDYLIADSIEHPVCVGGRVLVPFRSSVVLGFVVGIKKHSLFQEKLKPIYRNLDRQPVLDDEFFALAHKIQTEHFCSLGEAIASVLPVGLKRLEKWPGHPCESEEKTIPLFTMTEQEQELLRSPHFLEDFIVVTDSDNEKRWAMYEALIKNTLNSKRSVLFLVPDQKKIEYAAKKLNLGFEPYQLSSSLSAKESLNHWLAIKKSSFCMVAGTRSAIFAPVKNLGVIIIEEEGHFAYAQEQSPHYKVADIAFWRAKFAKARVILGSFMPTLESYYLKKVKKSPRLGQKCEYLSFAPDIPWPRIKLVDTRHDGRYAGREKILSKVFEYHIADSLQKKERVLVYVNKKGFSTFLYCNKCKKVQSCPSCSSSLVYYLEEKIVSCPICRYKTELFDLCQECKSSYIKFFGHGAQKVESEIKRLFPTAKISFLNKAVEGKLNFDNIDIVLTTQQFFENFHWHDNVFDSVCVVSCDEMLGGTDFRSTEKAFLKLLRLGRIARKQLCIQTRMAGHYIFNYLKLFDLDGFYTHELKLRKELKLPPCVRMGALFVRSKNMENTQKQAFLIYEDLEDIKDKKPVFQCFEPIPCAPFKVRGNYRFRIFFKYTNIKKLNSVFKKLLQRRHKGIITTIETDVT